MREISVRTEDGILHLYGELFTGFVDIRGCYLYEGDKVKWFCPFATPAIATIFYNEEDCSFRLRFDDTKIEDYILGRYIAGREILKIKEGEI